MDTETNVAAEVSESAYKILSFTGDKPGVEPYIGMVVSRWCRSLKYGNDFFKLIAPDKYWEVYPKFVGAILAKPETVIKIAVLSDDEDVALGFAVSSGDALHYVHVDNGQRRQGIATELTKNEFQEVTHLTKLGISFWNSRFPKAVFNPFRS